MFQINVAITARECDAILEGLGIGEPRWL